ncbi:hypothetical protein AcV7_009389 [Taiwanofungus camphoratus]|nr:hypothetical protein AcV7_009389 [Antrodia cinnamomea]
MFGAIVVNDRLVKIMCGAALPGVFELRCMRRYPMTEAEIQENEERLLLRPTPDARGGLEQH